MVVQRVLVESGGDARAVRVAVGVPTPVQAAAAVVVAPLSSWSVALAAVVVVVGGRQVRRRRRWVAVVGHSAPVAVVDGGRGVAWGEGAAVGALIAAPHSIRPPLKLLLLRLPISVPLEPQRVLVSR